MISKTAVNAAKAYLYKKKQKNNEMSVMVWPPQSLELEAVWNPVN